MDSIHDQIDGLVLAVFEAMRNVSSSSAFNGEQIEALYMSTNAQIDNLIGINRSESEQQLILDTISDEYAVTKASILAVEGELLSLQTKLDSRLHEVLSLNPEKPA